MTESLIRMLFSGVRTEWEEWNADTLMYPPIDGQWTLWFEFVFCDG